MPVVLELMNYKENTVRHTRRKEEACITSGLSAIFIGPINLTMFCSFFSFHFPQRVRLTSLECLSYLRNLPYSQLHPFRVNVLTQLGRSVDDHKRAVRQAAAKARNQWYLIEE